MMLRTRAGLGLALAVLMLAVPSVARADDEATSPPSPPAATADAGPAAAPGGVRTDLVPPGGFTDLPDAGAALLKAKAQVSSARADADAAKQRAADAASAVTGAQAEQRAFEADLLAAQQVEAERHKDVGQMVTQMYVSAGAMPGTPFAIMAIPAGVDLNAAMSTQHYLTSASDSVVAAERDASARVAELAGQVEAKRAEVASLTQSAADAQQQAVSAEGQASLAVAVLGKVEAALQEFVSSMPVPVLSAEDCAHPSADAIAAAIYAQAEGLGLGDVAALIGIGVGLGETGLSNNADGDCWGGDCKNGHTSSRGVFQQMSSWPPSGTAWSGQKGPTGGTGTRFDQFNSQNAWGPDGWAATDPRMDPAQAANMFFLGPNYGPSAGLEDNALFRSVRDGDPLGLSLDQMVTIAQQVQGFPVQHTGSYAQNMSDAVGYYVRLKAGRIPVPAFQAPLKGMYAAATTPATVAALKGLAPADGTKANSPEQAVPDNGLLIVGDSLAQGVATLGGAPDTMFGGPTKALDKVGIGSKDAIDQWGARIADGPSRVLVSLGSNDSATMPAFYGAQVDRLMAAAGKKREVYWFTLHYRPVDALNVVLRQKASQYPNLRLVDVVNLLGPTSGFTSASDKYLHPDAAGYRAMWGAALATMRGVAGPGEGCLALSLNGTPANPLASSALAYALAQAGKRYGNPEGNPPATWDCSKLTGGAYNYAWGQAGRPEEWAFLGGYPFLPHEANSYDQYRSGHFVFLPLDQAQPGDFLFFNGDMGQSAANPVDHVALVLDPTNMILVEAGDPVGKYSYASRITAKSSQPIVGAPKADGSPTMPGEPGWYPVVGRLIPASPAAG